jgi:hypothetical protein
MTRHLTKQGQSRGIYRGTGAVAIIGAARTAFLVGSDPADRQRRVLVCTKTNLSERPPALGFCVRVNDAGQPYLEWTGELDRDADDLLRLRRGRPAGDDKPESAAILEEWLRDGPRSRDRLYCKARAHGISERTLHRAKGLLNAPSEVVRHNGRNIWYWRMPEDHRPFNPDDDYAHFMEEFWSVDEPMERPANTDEESFTAEIAKSAESDSKST